jgi:hypothetical protein
VIDERPTSRQPICRGSVQANRPAVTGHLDHIGYQERRAIDDQGRGNRLGTGLLHECHEPLH